MQRLTHLRSHLCARFSSAWLLCFCLTLRPLNEGNEVNNQQGNSSAEQLETTAQRPNNAQHSNTDTTTLPSCPALKHWHYYPTLMPSSQTLTLLPYPHAQHSNTDTTILTSNTDTTILTSCPGLCKRVWSNLAGFPVCAESAYYTNH